MAAMKLYNHTCRCIVHTGCKKASENPNTYIKISYHLKFSSCRCCGLQGSVMRTCQPCQDLHNNKFLEGIVVRMEHGIAENTPFEFHGINGLIKLLNCKNKCLELNKALGLLSLPTICTWSIIPIIPSHTLPTIIAIEVNINMSFVMPVQRWEEDGDCSDNVILHHHFLN